MSILDKLLHRSDESADPEPAPCMHGALIPRWDSVADMGREDLATGYRCDSCGAEFSPDEVHALRADAVERLRNLSEPPSEN